MKIFLLSLLFITTLFSSTFEKSYTTLNATLDKVSSSLSLEEKTSLTFLILATHDMIASNKNLSKIQGHTLKVISNLQNKKVLKSDIEKLRSEYITMTKTKVPS